MTYVPVDVRRLDAVIDANRILSSVTVPVQKGQFTGIIGRNGSGKSTLLKCMSRILAPAAGSVTVEGLEIGVYSRRELARILSVVPQESQRTFSYSVNDVVGMGRYARQGLFSGLSAQDREACDTAMATAGISRLAGREIVTLSGGEWQRVLIARTLAQETGIVLLDEPTSHLDISHQIEILSALHALTRSGTTVLAVFHDLNLAAHYCDRIIALQEGRVAADGIPSEVITPDFLWNVFSLDAEVRIHPSTGKPLVFPRYAKKRGSGTGRKVHLVCGGGTGTDLLRTLHEAGCRVTAGVLAMNDTDYATSVDLGIPCSAEPPFSPVSGASRAVLKEQVRNAEILIVTTVPVGDGNLTNLITVEEDSAAPVFFAGNSGTAEVEDFCGGQANAILARLAASGRLTVLPAPAILAACTGLKKKNIDGDNP
jgi:iron complex transport system ATP-binding protein